MLPERHRFHRDNKMGDVFESYQIAQWRAASSEQCYAFAAITIDESGGNRIIERERAYRDGCKLDDTGAKGKRWQLEAKFENTIDEPGLSSVNGDLVLYPDILNAMIDSFDRFHDQAGDLYVPTRGWIRARLLDYRRKESPDQQDCADLTLLFVEDNEDRVDARAFTPASAKANARRLAETTSFDEQSDGVWGPDSMSLQELAAGLESWANAPGDMLAEVDQQAGAAIGCVNRVLKAFSQKGGTSDGRSILLDPESSSTSRKLHATKEIAAQARAEAGRGKPKLITVVFERDQSLVTIASLLKQNVDDLLFANPQIGDPAYIPAKTPVKIYAAT